jgi:hypothetical protein
MSTQQTSAVSTGLPFRDPRSSSEEWARDGAIAFGVAFGQACPNIWAPLGDWVPAINNATADEGRRLVKRIGTETRSWVLYLSLTAAVGGVALLAAWLARGAPIALVFLVTWMIWTLLWIIAYIVGRVRHGRVVAIQQERFEWLTDVAGRTAIAQILSLRSEAALHSPGSKDVIQPAGPPPEAAAFGASDAGALHLVAAWMKYLGESDARPLDIQAVGSMHYVCAVYNTGGPIPDTALHALVGRATADGRKPIAFASGEYSDAATKYANAVGLPVFVYDAVNGTLAARSEGASERLRAGL